MLANVPLLSIRLQMKSSPFARPVLGPVTGILLAGALLLVLTLQPQGRR